MYWREESPVVQRLERRQRRMQAEETVEIERAPHGPARRLWNRDRRTHPVVGPLAVRDHYVQRISGAALKQTDENFSVRGFGELHAECRAPQEARTESHRHERERSGFHESSAFHEDLLAALEFRGAEREPDY